MYAAQLISNGQLICLYDTPQQAEWLLKNHPVELINVEKSSHVLVEYTELGGPWGYGHQELSFETYGGIIRCLLNLCKWIQETIRTFGPDIRDIEDFFRHCRVYVNGEDKTSFLTKQVEKLDRKVLYV